MPALPGSSAATVGRTGRPAQPRTRRPAELLGLVPPPPTATGRTITPPTAPTAPQMMAPRGLPAAGGIGIAGQGQANNLPPMIPGTTPAAMGGPPPTTPTPTNPDTGDAWENPFDYDPETGGIDTGTIWDDWPETPSYEAPLRPGFGDPPRAGGGFQVAPPSVPFGGGGSFNPGGSADRPYGTTVGGESGPTAITPGGGSGADPGFVGPPLPPNFQPEPTMPPGTSPIIKPGDPGYVTPTKPGGTPTVPTGQPPSGTGYSPIIVQPTGGGGNGGPPRQESSSGYSYAKPVHTFDPADAQGYAPALDRENVDGLKFSDLLARESGELPFNEMIAREQAPDQQYGKQQALEAANEANALLAQGLKRRQSDIAGSLGARGMGEGGAAARLGDIATSETLGQQASNIRAAYENAARYGDERSLDIFGKNIGQRGMDIDQQRGFNQDFLSQLGLDVQQRAGDIGMANNINQGGLDLNTQRITQRGQDVDQQRTVAQIIQSLLGQDQREAWNSSSASGGTGGGGGGNNNYAFNNLLYDMFLR